MKMWSAGIGLLFLVVVGCSGEKKAEPVSTDCASSAACAEKGECTEQNGVCIVGSAADCKNSKVCKTQGWCGVSDVGGVRACKP